MSVDDSCQPPEIYLKHSTKGERHVNGVEMYYFRNHDKRPFLGGFKNKETGVEYHNAAMQTAPKKWSPSTMTLPDGKIVEVEQSSRETQTVFLKNRVTQTKKDGSTQMTTNVCYVSSAQDRLVTPGEYETADVFHAKRLAAVVKLQSYYRRWQARLLVDGIRQDKLARIQFEREQFEERALAKEARLQRELERRLNPKSTADFEMLFTALEKWRATEESKIREQCIGADKKIAMYELLERETELIASINRHRSKAHEDNKQTKNIKLLEKAASPKKWKAYDGRTTEMQTQFTPRARELLELYRTLSLAVTDNTDDSTPSGSDDVPSVLNRNERYDVLATLILTVSEHKCKLIDEIIQLAKREQDLLNRGTHENNLDGLRQRTLTLFFQYCREPVFNPEATRIAKVPVDKLQDGTEKYQLCTTSQKYLPSNAFNLGATSVTATKWTSKSSTQLDNEARRRYDNAPFRRMLKEIRDNEADEGESLPYLLTVDDIRWLVMDNWAGVSLLSSDSDINELQLVRWDRSRPWSPWNCILLTFVEAEAHKRLERLDEAYGLQLRDRVRRRHAAARQNFASLTRGLAEALREKTNGSWSMSVGPNTIVGHKL